MQPEWLDTPCAAIDETVRHRALERQAVLTKPAGSLGRLESLAVELAARQATERPAVDPVHIAVFAGDHGVAAEGVSAFPQAVTLQMLHNFAAGGAAISVLARELDAALEVINVGTADDPGPIAGVIDARVTAGTRNFAREAAMEAEQAHRALNAGRQAAERAKRAGARLFIGGEMGIANTTSAAALACLLLDEPPRVLAGRGTGLDDDGVARKAAVIERALRLHGGFGSPLEALRRVGGLEIAALAGAFVACAQTGICVLVDGFIASVAALCAERLRPGARDWFLFGHRSREHGHGAVLRALDAEPLLDLGMRLGEGSGAATALPLLRIACALHNGMATFEEAAVSGAEDKNAATHNTAKARKVKTTD